MLKDELARILDRELDIPEDTLVTITRVAISPDVHYATASISILGRKRKETLAVLKKNVSHIQQVLNRRVRIRPVPRIKFAVDEEEIKREGIEKSLAELKQKGEF